MDTAAFSIDFSTFSEQDFNTAALALFRYQYEHVALYQEYCNLLRKSPEQVAKLEDIPFLPISFFKSHTVFHKAKKPCDFFSSSGTTGQITSRHYFENLSGYEASFIQAFHHFYGDPKEWTILALLPNYLERSGSSLVYMVEKLIALSGSEESGFFLHNHSELNARLAKLEARGSKTLLIGVSFALLDFIEAFPQQLRSTTVMETGGMKGKRKEMIKPELHAVLKAGFGVNSIHSEYGMTELFSQGYSQGNNVFDAPPWMKIGIRNINDPLSVDFTTPQGGAINVIDLANTDSCAFIATDDLGNLHANKQFEILGRMDRSEMRGCNLMVQDL